MRSGSLFIPEVASTVAARVDGLYLFLVGLTAFFTVLIFALFIIFMVKYRRKDPSEVGARIHGGMILEVTWSVVPLFIVMGIFVWSTQIFFAITRPPKETMNVYAVGKQWMWKFQHLEGQREINELHVPAGRAVKVTISSEDVIHSLYFPSFRTKIDAIPGRYTELWFEADTKGTYHIFCAEYCGTNHSGMIGNVIVMDPVEYQAWLQGGGMDGTLAQRGAKLFNDLACSTCHLDSGQGRGPSLHDIVGTTVELADGSSTKVDEAYLRESILTSQAKVVKGFQPLMPTFQGLVSEENLVALIEHVKSLSKAPMPAATRSSSGSWMPTAASSPRSR